MNREHPARSLPSALVEARGPREAFRALLDDLDALLPAGGEAGAGALSALARPVSVVVPSSALRGHVLATLARERGALAGVRVETLFLAARRVLESAGETPPAADALFDLSVFEMLRFYPRLERLVAEFPDARGLLRETLSDLLNAGVEPELLEGLEDALGATRHLARETRERARDLMGVAADLGALAHEGLATPAPEGQHPTTLRALVGEARARAREALAQAPDEERSRALRVGPRGEPYRAAARALLEGRAELDERALIVFGFADTTGAAGELLEALATRAATARVILDVPARAASWAGGEDEGAERAFSSRFAERFGLLERIERPRVLAAPAIATLSGASRDAEARAVAEALRARLDAADAPPPERLAVVARDLEPYRASLARHLDRLGVPWSADKLAAPHGAPARRLRALLRLVAEGGEAPLTTLLEALGEKARSSLHPQLPLALALLGARRVRDARAIELDALLGERAALRLPKGLGARTLDDEADEQSGAGAPELARIPAEELARALERLASAARALDELREASGPRTLHRALDALSGAEALALDPEREGALVREALASIERGLGAPVAGDDDQRVDAFALDGRDLLYVFASRLERKIPTRVGAGRGGGVRVLGVTEARGLVFDELFLLGLNRHVFPRRIREDALLPDALREPLRASVLPDLPVKARGFEEERHLFASLVDAAPRVTLSWAESDAAGAALARSPLVEPFVHAESPRRVGWIAEGLAPKASGKGPRARSALECAIALPLEGADEESCRAAFARALDEAARALPAAGGVAASAPALDHALLASARRALVAEREASFDAELGPYLGLLGPLADEDLGRLWVSDAEALAGCGWQAFLARGLHLDHLPDPGALLEEADAALIGTLVHAALARLVRREQAEIARTLDAALAAAPLHPPAPGPAELEGVLDEGLAAMAAEQGLALSPGLARFLRERARPFVERALEAERHWPDAARGRGVIGAEVDHRLELEHGGERLALSFRIDRVDRIDLPAGEEGAGVLFELIDYKTGAPISRRVSEGGADEDVAKRTRAGRALQALAYAASVESGRGGFLYLSELDARVPALQGLRAEPARAEELGALLRVIADARRAGALVPRLVDEGTGAIPDACRHCRVAEACLQHESGTRARYARWLARDAATLSATEAAARALLTLGARAEGASEGENAP